MTAERLPIEGGRGIQLNGRRSPRRAHWLAFAAILAFALLAAACGRIATPQGWAGPTLSDDGKTIYVSIEPGKMAALDANMSPETGAQCDNAIDDDGDGYVNEGCPKAGQKSEEGKDCANDTNDDQNNGAPDDNLVNDGCPATIVRWVFPPDTDEGKKLKLEAIYGAPLRIGDAVYFGAYDGNVYALDAAAGTPLWRFGTDDPIVTSLVSKDGILFAASTDGRLYAIDAATGLSRQTPFDSGSSFWSSPLLVGDVIYVGDMAGKLHKVNADTLTEDADFSFKTNAGLLLDPTLANKDTLLVGGIDHKLYAIDPTTGKERWGKPFEARNWLWARPLINGDTAYVADLDGNVYGIDVTSGDKRWEFKATGPVRSAPLLAGDTLVIVDRGGKAFGLKPGDGSQQWGPTLLGKSVLSDPFLLEAASASQSAAASATPAASPSATAGAGAAQVLIVAQGGDLCRLNPADGTPTGAAICAQVPL